MQRLLLLAALILIAGCTRSPSITVCQAIDRAEKYNGSHVTIAGTFHEGHHPTLLSDSNCPSEVVVLGSEVTPNPTFRDAVSNKYFSGGSSIIASVEGKFIYSPSPSKNFNYLLDSYKVIEFEVDRESSSH
jgi:hypothetical protein